MQNKLMIHANFSLNLRHILKHISLVILDIGISHLYKSHQQVAVHLPRAAISDARSKYIVRFERYLLYYCHNA